MWKAYCDNILFYDDATPLKEYKLIDPTLELEENQPGTFTFTLPTENVLHELSNGGYFVTKDGNRYVFRTTEVQMDYSSNDSETLLYSEDLELLSELLSELAQDLGDGNITYDEYVEQSNAVREKFGQNYHTPIEEYLPGTYLSLEWSDITYEISQLGAALHDGRVSHAEYLEWYFDKRRLSERLAEAAKKESGEEYYEILDPTSVGRLNSKSFNQSGTAITVTTDTYYKFRQMGELIPFKSYIRVVRDDEVWFEGVANSISVNFNLEKEVTCDGVLSFLSRVCVPEAGVDFDVNYIYDMYAIHNPDWRNKIDRLIKQYESVQKFSEYDLGGILNTERAVDRILEIYGKAIDAVTLCMGGDKTYVKNFGITKGSGVSGETKEDVIFWKSNTNIAFEYSDALTAIQDIIGEKDVYLQVEYDAQGRRRLNFIHDETREKCSQVINFGENLLDYTESWEIDNLVTAALPLGMPVTLQTVDEDGNVVDVDDSYPKVYISLADLENYKPDAKYDLSLDRTPPKIGNSQFALSPVYKYSNGMLVDSSMVSERLKEIKELHDKGKIPDDEYQIEYERCNKLLKYYANLQTGNGGAIITHYRFIYDVDLVKQYGLRMAVINFDSEISPINLMWEAAQYIKDNQFAGLNLEVSAFDLSYLNDDN